MQCAVFSIFVLSFLKVAMGEMLRPLSDGQPGCLIRYEFGRYWPNNFDRHAYWECHVWGEAAVKYECPSNMSFQDIWQQCVPDADWQQTPYSEPPTKPGDTSHDQCEPLNCTSPPLTTTTPHMTEPSTTTPCQTEPATTPTTTTSCQTEPSTTTTTTPCPTEPSTTTTPCQTEPSTTTTPCQTEPSTTTTPCPTESSTTTTPCLTESSTTTPCPTEIPTTTTPCQTEPSTTSTATPCPTEPSLTPTIPPHHPEQTTTTTPPNPSGNCPGAQDGQYAPGPHSCAPPPCTWDQWQDEKLYPTRDPTKFYQCGPGVGNLYVMPCAPGTCFSFDVQGCVHVYDWKNPCTSQ
uniref:Chitin-binding type-2 domain-containing protein n=1 Tax=Phlebotomus papatasi TaxID=29031 RepID=A0A1B0D0Y4_PHLPP